MFRTWGRLLELLVLACLLVNTDPFILGDPNLELEGMTKERVGQAQSNRPTYLDAFFERYADL